MTDQIHWLPSYLIRHCPPAGSAASCFTNVLCGEFTFTVPNQIHQLHGSQHIRCAALWLSRVHYEGTSRIFLVSESNKPRHSCRVIRTSFVRTKPPTQVTTPLPNRPVIVKLWLRPAKLAVVSTTSRYLRIIVSEYVSHKLDPFCRRRKPCLAESLPRGQCHVNHVLQSLHCTQVSISFGICFFFIMSITSLW